MKPSMKRKPSLPKNRSFSKVEKKHASRREGVPRWFWVCCFSAMVALVGYTIFISMETNGAPTPPAEEEAVQEAPTAASEPTRRRLPEAERAESGRVCESSSEMTPEQVEELQEVAMERARTPQEEVDAMTPEFQQIVQERFAWTHEYDPFVVNRGVDQDQLIEWGRPTWALPFDEITDRCQNMALLMDRHDEREREFRLPTEEELVSIAYAGREGRDDFLSHMFGNFYAQQKYWAQTPDDSMPGGYRYSEVDMYTGEVSPVVDVASDERRVVRCVTDF